MADVNGRNEGTARVTSLLAMAMALAAGHAHAQRADENVITSAEDAFGTTVGLESIGLYDPTAVRGFSPTVAGNIRIEGLYFDQQAPVSNRLRSQSDIRVGSAALGYPFPAPTGIVDVTLRPSGEIPIVSAVAGYGPFGSDSLEVDSQLPIAGKRFSTALGGSIFHDFYGNGTSDTIRSVGLVPRWLPTEHVEVTGFWGRVYTSAATAAPIYESAGEYLPPTINRGRYAGPSWDRENGFSENAGLLATATLGEWTLKGGLFESLLVTDTSFANLFTDTLPDGRAKRILIADPPQRASSTSAELRASRVFSTGPVRHIVLGTIRWRSVSNRNGGSDLVDAGPGSVNTVLTIPSPSFVFSDQLRDHVNQKTAGVSYELRWGKDGEFNVGAQRTDYARTETRPDGATSHLSATPWLPSATFALNVFRSVIAYASYTQGLEDSGIAPDAAVNRLQPLPAIRTRQQDAGLKWTPADNVKLLVGYFSIRKPYLTIDRLNAYGALGIETHSGAEVSLSATPLTGMTVVAGAILSNPRVSNVSSAGEVGGSLPVAQPRRVYQLNIDYTLPQVPSVSLNTTINHMGAVAATVDDVVHIGSYTTLAVGGRYKFKVADKHLTLELAGTNLTNVFAWTVLSAGAYEPLDQRTFTARLTADF